MPATVTHAFFAIDVYKELKKEYQVLNFQDFNRLKMFGQSTDSMMFYNIESLKKGKELRKFQYVFHTCNSQAFFVKLCQIIKKKGFMNNHDVMAFLYGFICHYVLDSTVHPFIVYKTGVMQKGVKDTYKYNNLHSYMETFLDNYMIDERIECRPYHFRFDKFCFDTCPFDKSLNDIIDSVFFDVFQLNNMSKIYYKSLKQMKAFLRKYRFDPFGFKKMGYQFIDFFTVKSTFKFDVLSYHHKIDFNKILNLEHAIWYNSLDPSISSHDSFIDLYRKSISEAVSIIENVCAYFKGAPILLDKVFTNKSYLTGLDCNIPIEFKKFAF